MKNGIDNEPPSFKRLTYHMFDSTNVLLAKIQLK